MDRQGGCSSVHLCFVVPSTALSVVAESTSMGLSVLLSDYLHLLLFAELSRSGGGSSASAFDESAESWDAYGLKYYPLFSVLIG